MLQDDRHISRFMRVTLPDAVGPETDPLIAACIGRALTSPDCLDYRIFRDRQRADVLLVFERWADRAALDAHRVDPAFVALETHLAERAGGTSGLAVELAEAREIDPPYRARPAPAAAAPAASGPVPAPEWAAAMPMAEAPWTDPALEPDRIETPATKTGPFELYELETHGVAETPAEPAPFVEESAPAPQAPAPGEETALSRVGRWFRSLR